MVRLIISLHNPKFTIELEILPDDKTVLDLKAAIAEKVGISSQNDITNFKLVFSGKILKNEQKLQDFRLKDNSTIAFIVSQNIRQNISAHLNLNENSSPNPRNINSDDSQIVPPQNGPSNSSASQQNYIQQPPAVEPPTQPQINTQNPPTQNSHFQPNPEFSQSPHIPAFSQQTSQMQQQTSQVQQQTSQVQQQTSQVQQQTSQVQQQTSQMQQQTSQMQQQQHYAPYQQQASQMQQQPSQMQQQPSQMHQQQQQQYAPYQQPYLPSVSQTNPYCGYPQPSRLFGNYGYPSLLQNIYSSPAFNPSLMGMYNESDLQELVRRGYNEREARNALRLAFGKILLAELYLQKGIFSNPNINLRVEELFDHPEYPQERRNQILKELLADCVKIAYPGHNRFMTESLIEEKYSHLRQVQDETLRTQQQLNLALLMQQASMSSNFQQPSLFSNMPPYVAEMLPVLKSICQPNSVFGNPWKQYIEARGEQAITNPDDLTDYKVASTMNTEQIRFLAECIVKMGIPLKSALFYLESGGNDPFVARQNLM